MLTAIREGSKGWISGVIIGAIVLTFALFGISSYLEGGEETPVAVVNGEEIDNYLFQNQLTQQRQNMISQFGGSFDPAVFESLGLNNQVLESLIESRLLDQYTRSENYRLSDKQLSAAIQSNPLFQRDDRFDPELYQRAVAANGLSPQAFEATERRSNMVQQLQLAIAETSFTVDSELSRLYSLQNQERDARYALIAADKFVDEFEVSDEEAKKHYDENIDTFQNPARMKVEYIDLNLEKMRDEITPSEDDILQTYERLKGQMRQPSVRKASHILLTVATDADDATKQAAREKAEGLLAEANAGTDFGELAKEHSDDTGSAINGGDLGIVARGQMVPAFEDAVYSMSEGDISGPIETQFGFHLVKLTELTEERLQTLEEAREEVTKEASQALAEAAFADLVDPLETLIFEQDDSLVAASDETGLPIETSDWFTESAGEGVALEDAVRRAAFSADVKDDGLNSPIVELGFERIVALRKVDYEEANAKPFEEVKQSIIDLLKLNQSKEKLANTAPGMLENLTHLASWDVMVAESELTNETLAPQKALTKPELSELANTVFALKANEDGSPVFGHVVLANGDVGLYALNSVTLASTEDANENNQSILTQQLNTRDGAEMYRKFVGVLRSQAEVEIDHEQL